MMLKLLFQAFCITNAIVHYVNIMDIIPYEKGSFYVADKEYTDFLRLYKIHTNWSFFVKSKGKPTIYKNVFQSCG